MSNTKTNKKETKRTEIVLDNLEDSSPKIHRIDDLLLNSSYAEAASLYKELLGMDCVDTSLYHNLGVAYYKLGNPDEACKYLNTALEQPDILPSRTYYLLGLATADSGNDLEAIKLFDKSLLHNSKYAKAHFDKGISSYNIKDYVTAYEEFELACKYDSYSLEAFYNLGVLAVKFKKWNEAADNFSRCAELDRKNMNVYLQLLVQVGSTSAKELTYPEGHKIKNRLVLTSNNLRMFRQLLDGESKDDLEPVISELSEIINDLNSSLKRIETKQRKLDLIDLKDCLDKATFATLSSLGEIEIHKTIPDYSCEIIADESQVIECFINIILNAAEAMQGEGDLFVKIAQSGRTYSVRFQDNGPGIPASIGDKIFDLGFTTKENGSGFGLFSVHQYLRERGGSIKLDASDNGAVFVLNFTRSPKQQADLSTLGMKLPIIENVRDLIYRGNQ